MKVFKLEVMIIDADVQDIDEAEDLINNTRYANHTNVTAYSCREAEIGEWEDDNPLNNYDTMEAEIDRLFPKLERDGVE